MIPPEVKVRCRELVSKEESIRIWMKDVEDNKPLGYDPKATVIDAFSVSVRSAYSEGWKACMDYLRSSIQDEPEQLGNDFADMSDSSDRFKDK